MRPLPEALDLRPHQMAQLEALEREALRLNARINLVSAASARHFWRRHILHSLALAARPFPEGATVVDWGTGGGFPGLPLAVAFPNVAFHLVDAVGKKIQAVRTMARRLGLENVTATHARAEAWEGRADYAVSRATAPLAQLWTWTERVWTPAPAEAEAWPPGLLALKGGDLAAEIEALREAFPDVRAETSGLGPILGPDFADKALVHVTR